MIRLVIENILLFLLPTAVYVIFVAVTRSDNKQAVLDGAPLAWLMLAGTLVVVIVLTAFGSNTGGKPGQAYVPPSMKDGHIEPGRIQ